MNSVFLCATCISLKMVVWWTETFRRRNKLALFIVRLQVCFDVELHTFCQVHEWGYSIPDRHFTFVKFVGCNFKVSYRRRICNCQLAHTVSYAVWCVGIGLVMNCGHTNSSALLVIARNRNLKTILTVPCLVLQCTTVSPYSCIQVCIFLLLALRNTVWRCSRIACWGRYLGLRGTR